MNEKNIYVALNEVNGAIDGFEKVELTEIEKAKLRKIFKERKKNRFNSKKIGSIAVALVLGFILMWQSGVGMQVYAMVASALDSITYSIGKSLYLNQNIEPYVNVVNKVVEDNGVAVKLTECAIDKDELILTLLFENTTEKAAFRDSNCKIFVNGKNNISGASGSSGMLDSEDNIYFQTMAYHIEEIDTEQDLDVKVVINDIVFELDPNKEKSISGNWSFEFNASGKELSKNTKSVALDQKIDCGDFTIKLETLTINPVNKKIYVSLIDPNGAYQNATFDLIGYDNLGNEVEFNMRRYDGTTKKAVLAYKELNSELSKQAESLTLNAYVAKLPEGGGRIGEYVKVGESVEIVLPK